MIRARSLEPGDDRLGAHSQFDDLQRHRMAHRLGLFSNIDDLTPSFTDAFQQFVATESLPDGFVQFVRRVGLRETLIFGWGLVELVPPKSITLQLRCRLFVFPVTSCFRHSHCSLPGE